MLNRIYIFILYARIICKHAKQTKPWMYASVGNARTVHYLSLRRLSPHDSMGRSLDHSDHFWRPVWVHELRFASGCAYKASNVNM